LHAAEHKYTFLPPPDSDTNLVFFSSTIILQTGSLNVHSI
jgi:hypothetical protein